MLVLIKHKKTYRVRSKVRLGEAWWISIAERDKNGVKAWRRW